MKKMKKIIALALSMIMVVAMSVTAFASVDGGDTPGGGSDTATNYSLTISGTKTGHTYDVYQIFTGNITGTEGEYVLSDVKYGKSYIPSGKSEGDRVPADDIKNITDADAFIKSIDTALGTPFKTNVASADSNTVINDLPAGYYLVKETTQDVQGTDAATKIIVKVVGPTTVTVKSAVPTVEKKVKENQKNVADGADNRIPSYTLTDKYNDVADYNIGDEVPFKLIGTLPSRYSDYTKYKYYFHDTLSDALDYVTDSIHIYVENPNEGRVEVTSSFTTTYDAHKLDVKCEDLKQLKKEDNTPLVTADSKIVVEYNAKLNSSAQIGLPGNDNTVNLEFSNNPNQGGEGDTGTTPNDKVIVFTYELDTTKVDSADTTKLLQNAKFKLQSAATNKWAVVENEKVTSWVDSKDAATELVSGTDGKFIVKGLDDGTYNLWETVAPDGYKLPTEAFVLTITATTVNDHTWEEKEPNAALTKLEISANGETKSGETSTGTVDATITNNSSVTLPETGGIGTTIFYVVGAILMIGAGVMLVTRKRISR